MSAGESPKYYNARGVLPVFLREAGCPDDRAENLIGCQFELFVLTRSKGEDNKKDILFSRVVYGTITGILSHPYTLGFGVQASCDLLASNCRQIFWRQEEKKWFTTFEGRSRDEEMDGEIFFIVFPRQH